MKNTARLLLLAIILSSVSCGNNGTSGDTTVTGGDSSDATTAPDVTTEEPSLPDEYDLEKYDFRIIKQDNDQLAWALNTFHVTEENGEVLNDAIYKRNLDTSEKYNFTISETSIKDDPTSTVNKSIMAQDDEYDMAMLRGDYKPLNSAENFMNFYEIPNIDLSRSYYDQSLIRDTAINNKLYFLTGDILVSDNDSLMMIMYNRALAEDFGIENLYDVVRKGDWTYDVMNKYVRQVSADLDDNEVYDENDRYGLLYVDNNCAAPFFAGAKAYLFTKSGNSIEFTAESERTQQIFETMQTVLSDSTVSYNWAKITTDAAAKIASMIQNKQILFQNMVLSFVRRNFRDISIDFGLLPMPKLDSTQEDYMSMVAVARADMYVPVTVKELDKVGFIIEALSAASGEINEAYYKVCMESKYTRDEESVEMINMSMQNIVYDLGFIYDWGSIGSQIKSALMNGKSYTSLIASLKDSVLAAMDKTLEKIG